MPVFKMVSTVILYLFFLETRAQELHTYHVSTAVQQTHTFLNIENPAIKSSLNTSFLLFGIGVVLLLFIFVTHLYKTFKIKRKVKVGT